MGKPNKDRIKILTDALRSGEYPQDTGALRTDDGYCCLGVACDVAHKNGGIGEWRKEDSSGNTDRYLFDFVTDEGHCVSNATGYLPVEVADWFEVNDALPLIDEEWIDRTAAYGFNDRGDTFNQIADRIERTYLNDNQGLTALQ